MRIVAILMGVAAAAVLLFSGFNPLELKLKSGLQITTDDIPASLFLDGEYLDKSPYKNGNIRPKEYLLRIVPDDTSFAPYELPVKLNKGVLTVITWKPGPTVETSGGIVYEMERVRGREALAEVHSVPDGAIITVDGGHKQFSPAQFELSEGNHELEISLPSYQTQQHSVNVPAGHKANLTVVLGKLTTPPQAIPAAPAESSSSATPAASGENTVLILPTNFFFNNTEVLRVRATPSPVGQELGFAPVGSRYPFLGEQTGWYQIRFEDQPGWVSAQLSRKETNASTQNAP